MRLIRPLPAGITFWHPATVAAKGKPVLINVHIGSTDFRKGSISM